MNSEAISHRIAYLIFLIMAVSVLYAPWYCHATSSESDAATPTRTYSWHQATAAAPWPIRWGHAVVVFKDKLWLLGGVADLQGSCLNDIWSSTDGVNWTQVTSNAPWSPRVGYGIVFQDNIWLLGDARVIHSSNDVWSSTNGLDWVNASGVEKWIPRSRFGCAALPDHMFVLGGSTQTDLNDVWFSQNGDRWAQAMASADWIPRRGHEVLAFHDRLWLFGGIHYEDFSAYEYSYPNDVWSTSDGVHWTLVDTYVEWHGRESFAAAVYNNQLWVLGGAYSEGQDLMKTTQILNDVWSSTDGANWTQEPAGPWLPRGGHSALTFRNRLWVLGGWAEANGQNIFLTNDIWYMEPDPGAMLSGSPVSGTAPLTIQFTDASTATAAPISAWHWDFGDGTSSTDQNPTHTYSNRGVYTVSLTVTAGSFYNSDTEEAYITVTGEQHPFHTADQNQDNVITLSELLRVIQFYNSDAFHCQSGTEDGYATGLGDTACSLSDSDYNPPDWKINLTELLRIVQLYNSGGYHSCPGSEDGFCPGP